MCSDLPEPDANANEIDVERILEEVKHVPSALREELIDQVIQTVGEAHLATVTPTRQKVREANEKFAQKKLDGFLVSHFFFKFRSLELLIPSLFVALQHY